MKSLGRIAATGALALTSLVGIGSAAHAATAAQCTDKYQIGSTSYVNDTVGNHIASVKQYWSPACQENFAYIYVWQSFRDSHPGTWTIDVAEVYVIQPGNELSVDNVRTYNTRGSDFWSSGYAGAGKCTYASGGLYYGSNFGAGAKTDTRCG